jgi:hypothetical protein
MSIPDVVLLALIGAGVFLALRAIRRGSSGGCCGSCGACRKNCRKRS